MSKLFTIRTVAEREDKTHVAVGCDENGIHSRASLLAVGETVAVIKVIHDAPAVVTASKTPRKRK